MGSASCPATVPLGASSVTAFKGALLPRTTLPDEWNPVLDWPSAPVPCPPHTERTLQTRGMDEYRLTAGHFAHQLDHMLGAAGPVARLAVPQRHERNLGEAVGQAGIQHPAVAAVI